MVSRGFEWRPAPEESFKTFRMSLFLSRTAQLENKKMLGEQGLYTEGQIK